MTFRGGVLDQVDMDAAVGVGEEGVLLAGGVIDGVGQHLGEVFMTIDVALGVSGIREIDHLALAVAAGHDAGIGRIHLRNPGIFRRLVEDHGQIPRNLFHRVLRGAQGGGARVHHHLAVLDALEHGRGGLLDLEIVIVISGLSLPGVMDAQHVGQRVIPQAIAILAVEAGLEGSHQATAVLDILADHTLFVFGQDAGVGQDQGLDVLQGFGREVLAAQDEIVWNVVFVEHALRALEVAAKLILVDVHIAKAHQIGIGIKQAHVHYGCTVRQHIGIGRHKAVGVLLAVR